MLLSHRIAMSVLLVLLVVMVRAAEDEEDDSPAAQEEKYRDFIKCGACETMVKGLAERAASTPLGQAAPQGQNKRKTAEMRQLAARKARAYEFIEGACDHTPGGPRERLYCEQSVEALEEQLVELVVHDGIHPSFANATDICLPVCEYKSSLKTQITELQDEIRRKHTKDVGTQVLELLREYWLAWAALFVAVLVVSIAVQLRMVHTASKGRAARNGVKR